MSLIFARIFMTTAVYRESRLPGDTRCQVIYVGLSLKTIIHFFKEKKQPPIHNEALVACARLNTSAHTSCNNATSYSTSALPDHRFRNARP